MCTLPDIPWRPLREAVDAWALAVAARDAEVFRVAACGDEFEDTALRDALLVAVDEARDQCEEIAARITRTHPKVLKDWSRVAALLR